MNQDAEKPMNYQKNSDEFFMDMALNEANKAFLINEVPIGAVIVNDDGIVISKGFNTNRKNMNFLEHAEINAMVKACKKLDVKRLDGMTLYVTLEPCLMCLGAILNAHIKRVVVGLMDSKNGAIKSILNIEELNFTHKFSYTEGVLKERCLEVMQLFFKNLRK